VRVPEYALDNQPDIQFASVFGLTTKLSNGPGRRKSQRTASAPPRSQELFWVTPNRQRPPGEILIAASDCAKGFAGQKVFSRSRRRCDPRF